MATVTKDLFYELTLRGSSAEPHQKQKPGEVEGIHLVLRTRFVDEETGEIVGTPKGCEQDVPVPITLEAVQKYLGDKFADLVPYARTMAERDAAFAQIGELEKVIAAAAAAAAQQQAEHQAALEAIDAARVKAEAEVNRLRQAVAGALQPA